AEAHGVEARNTDVFRPKSTANPERSATAWLRESIEYVRFVNPGDLRAQQDAKGRAQSCASSGCHEDIVYKVQKSMMTHGAFLWGAALYNNGAYWQKDARYGESYAADGSPQSLRSASAGTAEEMRSHGILSFLDPLPEWAISQPG